MACGCSGSGGWQAEGLVPATNIRDASYFWPPPRPVTEEEQAAQAAKLSGVGTWSPATGTTQEG